MDPRIHQMHQTLPMQRGNKTKQPQSTGLTFKDVLQSEQQVKVSRHAKQRLVERNIKISDTQWSDISTKMNEAKSKGVTDSLVVLKDATLVVSTKNNTVVTAMDKHEASSHIFTNINGTILMEG